LPDHRTKALPTQVPYAAELQFHNSQIFARFLSALRIIVIPAVRVSEIGLEASMKRWLERRAGPADKQTTRAERGDDSQVVERAPSSEATGT
jgi:hypothetical protein